MPIIHDEQIRGVDVDSQTRCAHYHGDADVIAIKFKCCGRFFPCYECHAECSGHAAKVWSRDERETRAILCGVCGYQLTIAEYFACNSICPKCNAAFNPNCAKHYALYFEIAQTSAD